MYVCISIYHRADGVYIHGFYFFALFSKLVAILFSYFIFFVLVDAALFELAHGTTYS